MMAGLRGGKEDFASASPLPFSSSSLPDPGRYRRSSLAPSAATEGVSSRGNQTFNGALRRSSMNMSFNNPYRKSSLVKASFMGNRSNLNVSFQLVRKAISLWTYANPHWCELMISARGGGGGVSVPVIDSCTSIVVLSLISKRYFTCDHFSQSYEGSKIAILVILANLGQLTGDIIRAINA